ncbi:S8 family peptidase [Gynurincola endophyticus]|uniref:S8 family peptidase n=1 Tax=Gynurincola endophyticus TaxID=2479004 RepID=UPI0018F6ADF4|nr:S8 family peptidase [Gynurincola endophyticus]
MNHFVKSLGLVTLLGTVGYNGMAQTSAPAAIKQEGWHLKDLGADGIYGISLQKAYDFLKTKNKTSNPVIVGVIDSGIDTTHEDLKPVLWKNLKEIPGNGIDDDGNGYIDDIYGWNFLGNKKGENVGKDSYEAARVYHKFKSKYEGVSVDTTKMNASEKYLYYSWVRAKDQVLGGDSDISVDLFALRAAVNATKASDSVLRDDMKKKEFTGNELKAYAPQTEAAKRAKAQLLYLFEANQMMDDKNTDFVQGFQAFLDSEEGKDKAKRMAPEEYRNKIVGDNYNDIKDIGYGNSDVMANTPFHGTHVSGIIAAVRNNGLGLDGVADNVSIMTLRAVPDGDEHDKDIALAIRYAVDNGAKVINMSFGKSFSPEKHWVDDAVKYAADKGVLLVHAAGNDAKNVDIEHNYPKASLLNGEVAKNWIEVGASGDFSNGGVTARFSNYGKSVDVFAPGVRIYSTIPGGNTYGFANGTSMASPVVAGVAALLMSYYPYLTAEQVKEIIEKSVVAPENTINIPGTTDKTNLNTISKTGGVVNVYNAVVLADTYPVPAGFNDKKPVKEKKQKKEKKSKKKNK